jgi:hypothetical protein
VINFSGTATDQKAETWAEVHITGTFYFITKHIHILALPRQRVLPVGRL